MLFLDLLQWWYSAGWLQQLKAIEIRASNWFKYFSVGTLLRTLFSPWKQIISSSAKDKSINAKFSALLDNLVSRLVGFVVRVFALITAVIVVIISIVLGVLLVLIWPFVPLAPLVFMFFGASTL